MARNNPAKTQDINIDVVTEAVSLAENALAKAKAMLAGAAPAANNSSATNKTSSGGRAPSPLQLEIRQAITDWATSDQADLFTVKSMTAQLGKDQVQVRNAIKYLTESGVVMVWAEKVKENGPGNREHVYKPAEFDVGI